MAIIPPKKDVMDVLLEKINFQEARLQKYNKDLSHFENLRNSHDMDVTFRNEEKMIGERNECEKRVAELWELYNGILTGDIVIKNED